jgi:hypothetical protein
MRICDPFREAGLWFKVADRHVALTCTCGVQQRADDLQSSVAGQATVYGCRHCGARLIGVAKDDSPATGAAPGAPPTDVDGHRMMGYVFGSTVELKIWPPAAVDAFMAIPPAPGFFSARGLG